MGTLAGGLGCCPFDAACWHAVSHSGFGLWAFAVCRPLVGGEAPAGQQRSTSHSPDRPGLHLNAFRGEPAISVFVWHFTPTHSSSETFATGTGSALHAPLRALQPGHGWLTRFQVYHQRQTRALHTRFPSGSGCHCLNQATDGNSSGHTPKGTRSPWCQRHPTALTAWTRSVSGSVSLPSPGCFSPFPHGTVRYRSQPVVSLGPWSTPLPTRFLVSRGTRAWASGIGVVRYGTLTLCGAAFQPLCAHPSTPGGRPAGRPMPAHNPRSATPAGLTRSGFWQIPFRSPLLWDLFRFLGVLRCFSSPTYLPSKTGHPGRPGWGCPIRRHMDRCLTAAPHAYRCWSASFIGWLCRGILPPRIMSCLGLEYSAVMGNAHDPSARALARR